MSADTGALLAVLAAFDDAALETLASRGLLRRAQRDVEAGKVVVERLAAGGATVSADRARVQMDAAGPAGATCSCPASGVCRHRLGAALVLRALAAAGPLRGHAVPAPADASGPATPVHPPSETDRALRETLGLAPSALARWAGKAALRAAQELLEARGPPHIELVGQSLVVGFGEDLPEVRILPGGGLDGIVSKASRARRKTLHAAAVLGVRQAHLAEPLDGSTTRSEPTLLAGPEPRFLDHILAVLVQCFRTGFNQAPVALEERLFATSVTSRADRLPRLASMLRTLAARVRARRERDFSLDAEAFLILLAQAYALLAAVRGTPPGSTGAVPSGLLGAPTRDYLPVGEVTAYGTGTDLWGTVSGARGVTGYLYSPAAARWFNVSVARPNGRDVAFDPVRAYDGEALWRGAPLARLEGTQIGLSNATAAADGRLSLAASVTARIEPWTASLASVSEWPSCFDTFEALQRHLRETLAGGLSANAPGSTPVLLKPVQWAPPYFDELRQCTVWPVGDGARWLGLTLAGHADASRQAAAATGLAGSHQTHLVAALASPVGQHFELRPYAVWVGDEAMTVVSLGLSDLPTAAGTGAWTRRALRRIARGAVQRLSPDGARFTWERADGTTSRVIAESLDALLGLAEVGQAGGHRQRFETLAQQFAALELTPLANVHERVAQAPETALAEPALQAVYVTATARSLARTLPWLRAS